MDASVVDGTATDHLRRAIGYAVRAPSSHNSQPWRFQIRQNGVDLRADRSRGLAVVDPDGRELAMSCGAALFILRCALQHLGYEASVSVLPEPADRDLLARVQCAPASSPAAGELQLFAAIGQRQTHRGAFLVRQLPHGLLAALKIAAEAEGAWLMHVERAASRVSLADLVAEGDRAQCSDHLFRRELSSWLRPNASPLGDGLPGYTLGFGGFMSRVAPRLVRTFDVGPRQARIDRKLVLDAPALLLLGTDRDDQGHWLAAGQALGHVLLRAAAEGVSAGFMNQPVQCPALRDRLNATLGRPGFAQIVMRLGHAQLGKPCWRRPVQDVVD